MKPNGASARWCWCFDGWADAIRRTSPLIDERGLRSIARIASHPCAPRWNRVAGDRLERDDVRAVDAFRDALVRDRSTFFVRLRGRR